MNKKTVIQLSGGRASQGMQDVIRNARNGTGGFI
jgi:hypothetical protein